MDKDHIESGFSGPRPEDELPDFKSGDFDEVLEGAGEFSKEKASGPDNPESKPELPDIDVGEGDIIVSKSGSRRRVTEINLHALLPGGGEIRSVKTDPEGRKSLDVLTFNQYLEGRAKGIITIEKKSA